MALAACGLVACGGSTTDRSGRAGAGGVAADAGDSGGSAGAVGATGGAGGSAGTTGTAGTGGSGVTTSTTTCGAATCSGQPVPFFGELPPCCLPDATGKCGLDVSAIVKKPQACVAKHQPGSFDAECPPTQLLIFGFTFNLRGCCKPDTDKCGYLMDSVAGYPIGLGCVDPASAGYTFDGGAKACTPGSGGADGAAGSPSDAGAG